MMRKILFLLIAVFAFTGTAMAQRNLTVYENGSSRNGALPVMLSGFSNYTKSQFVLTSSELSGMAGGTIHLLKFYPSSNENYTSPSTVDVFMKEVSYTTMSAFESKASSTIVYHGQLTVNNGVMMITLTTPFTYNGGNLLIGFENVTTSENKEIYFYCGSRENLPSCSGSSSSSLDAITWNSFSSKSAVPKTTFYYTLGNEPFNYAYEPANVTVTELTRNSAKVSWTAPALGNVTGYGYQYKKNSDSNWSTETVVTTTSATLSGLSSITAYNFRVRSLTNNGASDYVSVNFTTDCDIQPLPYTYGFETVILSPCWTLDTDNYATKVFDFAARTGTQGFCFSSSANPPQSLFSPEFPSNVAKTLSFWYKNYGANYPETFRVVYVTNNNDNLMVFGNTVTASNTQWTQYEEKMPDGTMYFIIQCLSNNQARLYIDDVSVTEYNPYPKPTGLTMAALAARTATVSWTAPAATTSGSPTGYAYQYKKATDSNWSAETTVTTVSAALSNLTPNTAYDFRVRAKYGSNASDYASITFVTDCEAQPLPYTDGFENGIGCWTLANCVNNTGVSSTYGACTGSKSFDFFFTANPPQYLISPEFDSATGVTVSFQYKKYSADYTEKFQVGYSTTTTDPGAFTWSSETTVGSTDWKPYAATFPAGTKYIAIRHNSQNQTHLLLDDFEFTQAANAEKPANLTMAELETTTALIRWTDPSSQATAFTYQYKKATESEWSTVTRTATPSAYLSSLTAGTAYNFRVRVDDGTHLSTYAYIDFTTDFKPTYLPFTEGFENGIGCWKLVNCKATTGINAGAAHTDDNGFVFVQDATAPQYLISPEIYPLSVGVKVSFWYKNFSSSYPEKFQVGYSTATNDLTDFIWYDEVTATTTLWTQYEADFPNGTRYVAVRYNSTGTHRLYLDDFSFSATTFYLTSLKPSATSATVSWEGTSDSYKVKYRAKGTTVQTYSEDFEDPINIRDTWTTNFTMHQSNFVSGSGYNNSRYSFRFNTYSPATSTQCIISPAFNATAENAKLTFYYRGSSTNKAEQFVVGYSSTNNSKSSIIWLHTYNVPTGGNWILCEETLPAGAKYIAIQAFCGSARNYLDIDNISIQQLTPWSIISTTGKSATMTGLTASTQYEMYIVGMTSGADDVSTTLRRFTTLNSGETYCYEPTNVTVANITATTATVSWTAPSGSLTGYTYQYKRAKDDAWGAETTTSATSATFSGLASNTAYDIRIKANYGTKASAYAYATFTTAVGAKTLPFIEDFEAGVNDWTMINCHENTGLYNYEAHESNYCFRFYETHTPPQYLISPLLDNSAAMTVSFWYRNLYTTSPETFQVGYSTTTNDITAFTWGNTITAKNTEWTQYVRDFPQGTRYVAIRHTSEYQLYLLLDDFIFEANTDVGKPTDLTMGELTAKSAMVSWIAPASGSPTGYAYQYKKVNDASWSTETQVTATFVTLSGLASNTAYTFRVRAVYDGSYSNYAYIDFTTDCAIQSLPFDEGFENGIGCWQLLVNKEDNAITGIDTKAKHTGSYGFKFVPDAPSPQYLISPEFDGSTAVKLAFYYKNASTDNAETFQAGYSTTGSAPADFTWEEEVTATNAEWTQYKTEFPEGTKYVAVKYTSEGKTNIYLDDFTFEQASILVKTIWPTDNSAYISWTGNNDSYQMKYRQAAFIPGQFTLFTENFEGDSWTSNWTRSSDGTRETESDGTHFYRFSTFSLKAKTKYLLSRQLSGYTGGATLRLYYRAPQTAAASAMGESFYVGYSTTDSNVSSFVWGASINAPINNTNWQLYEMTLPVDVKYVGIKTSANILAKKIDFDNITITNDKTVYPWSSVSTTESSVMLTSLTPATEYEYQILGLDADVVTTSTQVKTFTTLASDAVLIEGDANGDGIVTITDAVAIANHIVGISSEHFEQMAADVNHDGKITISDAAGVVNIILSAP